jgi:hypothetical protein
MDQNGMMIRVVWWEEQLWAEALQLVTGYYIDVHGGSNQIVTSRCRSQLGSALSLFLFYFARRWCDGILPL